MKKLFIILGLAVATLSVPLSAQAQTIEEKVAAAHAALTTAYTRAHADSIISNINSTIATSAPIRYQQLQAHRGWTVTVNGTTHSVTTFDQAIDLFASRTISGLSGYHFQSNSTGSRIRIRLREADGSYFGDWIYASTTSELIANLATEVFEEGFERGFANGYSIGYGDGYRDGFIDGYYAGYDQAECDYGGGCQVGPGR